MTPIELLAEAANQTISRNWKSIRKQGRLSSAPTRELALALAYFSDHSKLAQEVAREKRVQAAEEDFARKQRAEDVEPLSNADAFFFLLMAGLVLLAVIIAVLNYPKEALVVALAIAIIWLASKLVGPLLRRLGSTIPERWLFFLPFVMAVVLISGLLRALPSPFTFILVPYLGVLIWVTMSSMLRIVIDPEFAWETVGGHSEWLHSVPIDVLETERLAIMNAMSEGAAVQSGGESAFKMAGESAGTSLLPAPPGVTEIVLEQSQSDVFGEMRAHLTSVRRYHKIVLWLLIVAFMTFFGVGVYKLLARIQTPGDYFQAFGSSGIGALLLWFGQRTLWANRVSQLSLALFESHVAEVTSSLKEIPTNVSSEDRRRIRAEIWSEFRTGLNRIWLAEKKLLDDGLDRSKGGDSSKGKGG